MNRSHSGAFERDSRQLSKSIAQMGGLVESQIALSLQSILRQDEDLAAAVVSQDARVDDIEDFVNDHVMRMLARHEVVSSDLREVIAALKVSSSLERIGDLAKNSARRGIAIGQSQSYGTSGMKRLGELVQELIKDVLDAYLDRNADRAMAVWRRDQEVDSLHNGLFRELLTYMMEDPRQITTCTHLLFIAKNMERIGDHATNIAENVFYLVRGEKLTEDRAKSDVTSDTTARDLLTRDSLARFQDGNSGADEDPADDLSLTGNGLPEQTEKR